MNPHFERIWQTVTELPPGRVASYGQVAALAGLPGRARLVGRALRETPDGLELPWHRVLTASGRLAFPPDSPAFKEQAARLAAEGVLMLKSGRVDLKRHGLPPVSLDALLWAPQHWS